MSRTGSSRTAVQVAVLVGATIAATGCGEQDDEPKGPPKVVITEQGYDPAELTIEAGQRVTFVNRAPKPGSAKDDRNGPIDVSSKPGGTAHDGSEIARASAKGFATHSLFQNERQVVVFPVARTYRYHSAFDPDLTGTIEVVEPGE